MIAINLGSSNKNFASADDLESAQSEKVTRALLSVGLATVLTSVGCSGGGSAPGGFSATAAIPATLAATGRVSFSIGAPSANAAARHSAYISRGMKSLAIVVTSATTPSARTVFDCSVACTGTLDAPIAQDTFAITVYDGAAGTGNALASGLTSLLVREGVANQFSAVLGGIVAKLSLALAPSAFTSGTPGRGTLTVVPLDASGNAIVGSDAFATPALVSLANGAFTLGTHVITDPSNASIPISYTGALFSAPATVTATAAGLDVASLPLMLGAPGTGTPPTSVSGRTVSANAFVDSIGLDTHLNYAGTAYMLYEPTIVQSIVDLHVKHVREGMLYPFSIQPATLQAAVHALSAAGVHTLAGIAPPDLTASDFATRWSNWFDSVGGTKWVEGAEAPNECDLNGCLAQIPAYQQKLYATVKGYGPSIGVPVVGPSFANQPSYAQTGNLAQYLDFGNVHLYTLSQPPETTGLCRPSDQCAGGANLGSLIGNTYSLDSLLKNSASVSGTKPIMNSEAGLCTTVSSSGDTQYNNVPRDVQAAYWPRYLLHAFGDLGLPRTYIYELADDGTSAPDFDQCGLLDRNAVPKPSYRILKTMLDAVNDPGDPVLSTPLVYSVSAPKNVDGNDVSSMALASRNGSYAVFVWNPVSLFYQRSGNGGFASHPLAVATLAGNLSIGQTFGSAQLTTFDLTTGAATTSTVDASKPIPLSITPAITMVTLRP